ncbi:MAG: type II toxin-antitoxin system RelE/ParE family toxin [Spirochaetaceae bacterium]|jgi:phage-related protein|nr:type II toxin-antitoxin system RelE/ParE family toxin [Spirochaetaceae bacterium]
MDKDSCTIYRGHFFTLEWYYDVQGKSQVYDYFLSTLPEQKRKFLILAKKIGDFGKIYDKTKFRNEGDGIYAFKPQPDRYLSFFTQAKKIIVTNGFLKKTNKLPKTEKELALKRMQDYIKRNSGGNNDGNDL